MPITHTNRKGVTYTLCQGTTKTGKPRYYFTPNPGDNALDAIPDGWEISESINAVVSLVRRRPQQIEDAEVAGVRAALDRHPQGKRYRVEVRDKEIVVYARQEPDLDDILQIIDPGVRLSEEHARDLKESMTARAHYEPVMRFTLVDPESRRFTAARMGYTTSRDGWQEIHRTGSIGKLARQLIPTLDTDEFFQL